MKKHCVFFLFACLIVAGCGSGISNVLLEPEKGLVIRISDIKLVKSQKRVLGFVEIENTTDRIIKVSNRELFLCCEQDSTSASVKMPGEWEIDKGLISIPNSKPIRCQVYWPVSYCKEPSDLRINYVRWLQNEEEE